ncbi:MAG: acyl-CoA dehydrogenase [Actinomycetota bacterium]|nr:acyl-CoA dehydrogenase [Actinomycetota bacterium]
MDLSFTAEQEALREAFASLFAHTAGTDVVRAAEPLGFDEKVWDQLVRTGAPAMAVPEGLGGGGAGFVDLIVVAQELGKRLAPAPLVEAVVATNLIAEAAPGGPLLQGLVDQDRVATLALQPVASGTARLVPAGAVAEVLIALDGDELVAFERPAGARPHVPSPPNLGASPIADWSLDGPDLQRTVLAGGAEARRLHHRARAEWQLLMAAALDGLRSAALDIGVEYVKSRWAFGVPIGWFQAIQHRLADVATAGEGAQLLLYEAAWARDTGGADADRLAAMAFLYQSELAQLTTRESLQFHGGYGYTLEYDIQLYFRRAKAWPLALGDPARLACELARDLFAPES